DRALVRVPAVLVVAQIQRGAQPTLTVLSTNSAPAPVLDLAASGRLAFLAMGAAGMEVVEIADDGTVSPRGYLSDALASVVAYGSVVAGGGVNTTVTPFLIDVSDPWRPVATYSWGLPW